MATRSDPPQLFGQMLTWRAVGELVIEVIIVDSLEGRCGFLLGS